MFVVKSMLVLSWCCSIILYSHGIHCSKGQVANEGTNEANENTEDAESDTDSGICGDHFQNVSLFSCRACKDNQKRKGREQHINRANALGDQASKYGRVKLTHPGHGEDFEHDLHKM
ncbi:hypothetical protein L207DRAFT_511188 [Hyaloscypha variabilis F]|uniref:Uncharacterized protein n=1 Tax=Hyaloscypha variabilis (strain UAMH 11265 / GT02V1 / F) TaxID=1149755 RepID=A0A2J6RRZ4_HYAVF|nr:hypothetical protein L207DRAFT_511188 [Hyaloscypha variabilis F]